jgi:hypothetical protein
MRSGRHIAEACSIERNALESAPADDHHVSWACASPIFRPPCESRRRPTRRAERSVRPSDVDDSIARRSETHTCRSRLPRANGLTQPSVAEVAAGRHQGNRAELSARTFCTFKREFSSFRRQRAIRGSQCDPGHGLRIYWCNVGAEFSRPRHQTRARGSPSAVNGGQHSRSRGHVD